MQPLEETVLERCQAAVPSWRGLPRAAFELSPPRGFSSFTMTVRCHVTAPFGVLYRQLGPKPNTLLSHTDERGVYEALADAGVAAPLVAYEGTHRIEEFYEGRSLTREDLRDHELLRKIGQQLAGLHAVTPPVPTEPFFELIAERWRGAVRQVLVDERERFPAHEQEMCDELLHLLGRGTLRRVDALLAGEAVGFAHNDTYHGNIMLLAGGEVRLLDFEFSCLNVPAFDFANLFAETTLRHKLPDPPYFALAEPDYSFADVLAVTRGYVEAGGQGDAEVQAERALRLIPLSDFMYAMAATTLAVEPIQKIRFIPYALERFRRFLRTA